jgi:BolA protein
MKMEEKIRKKLEASFHPDLLVIKNQSHLHAGHAGDDGSGESHFHLEIQSHDFDNLSAINAQRAIYEALSEEMKQIHALSIKVIKYT